MRLDYKTHTMIALTVIAFVSWITYLFLEPPPAIQSRRVLLTERIERGGMLTLETTWTFSRSCGFYLFREVTDAGGTIIFSDFDRRFREQQPDNVAVTRFVIIPISSFAEVGPAVYQTHFAWGCNFIQELFPMRLEKGQPIRFEIVDQDMGASVPKEGQ